MSRIEIRVNGRVESVDVEPEMPLLWVLRDVLQLTGTKFGCGSGFCGACTVLIDSVATRSCVMPVRTLGSRNVTTIEGLGPAELHPLQRAWIDADVPQCGYCQAGQLMSAASLVGRSQRPTAEEIDSAMAGNLCRCGTYPRIRDALLSYGQRGDEGSDQ